MNTVTYTISFSKEEQQLLDVAALCSYQPMNEHRLKDQILREARAVLRHHADRVVDESRKRAAWLAENNLRAMAQTTKVK